MMRLPVGGGRRPVRRALRALAAAFALALGQPPAAVALGPGGAPRVLEPAEMTLAASSRLVVAGAPVSLSGALGGDPSCRGGRAVRLEARPPGRDGWDPVAETASSPEGSFGFTVRPSFNASYRAVALDASTAAGSCPQATSEAVPVQASARVEASPATSSVEAGACIRLTVSVVPAKPGQEISVERRRGDRWVEAVAAVLDPSSSAAVRMCFAWADIGATELRVIWPGQDDLNAEGSSSSVALDVVRALWMERIDGIVADRDVSVSMGEAGTFMYRHADSVPRIPASVQKLVQSMALLDALGPDATVPTIAAARGIQGGVVRGDLWVLGRGDPETGRARLGALARRIAGAGVRKVRGSVMGGTGYFRHDWWAPGWQPHTRIYVAMPTALTYEGNTVGGRHVTDPERWVAVSLTRQLERRGVDVVGSPGAGRPPGGLADVAKLDSRPLQALLARQNRDSANFVAEVLGKLLGAQTSRPPGTIQKGATAVESWARTQGVRVTAHDASGLSYANRVSAAGLVRLLWVAEAAPWGEVLRGSLPAAGQGTLEHRLEGVTLRAKTGTLRGVSALSGWVWLERVRAWGEFSILSRGMSKAEALRLEDAVVRTLARSAR